MNNLSIFFINLTSYGLTVYNKQINWFMWQTWEFPKIHPLHTDQISDNTYHIIKWTKKERGWRRAYSKRYQKSGDRNKPIKTCTPCSIKITSNNHRAPQSTGMSNNTSNNGWRDYSCSLKISIPMWTPLANTRRSRSWATRTKSSSKK
jgi:hypothetical protein